MSPSSVPKCSHCAPSSFPLGVFVQISGATSSKKSSLTTYLNPDPHIFPSATSPEFFSDSFLIHYSISSVQSLSCVQLFATPRTAAHQASLSITNFWNLPKLMYIESIMPSNHLILCLPLLLLPSIFPRIRVFLNESALRIRWPKDWSFTTASVLPMDIQDDFL